MRKRSRLLAFILESAGLKAPENCTLEQFMDLAIDLTEDQSLILLMDELIAALCSEELDHEFWWCMRSLSQSPAGNVCFVLASHQAPMLEAMRVDKASPFFNIFTTVEMAPFTKPEALEFMLDVLPEESKETIEWIIQASGKWPALLQHFARECYLARSQGRTDDYWKVSGKERMEYLSELLESEA